MTARIVIVLTEEIGAAEIEMIAVLVVKEATLESTVVVPDLQDGIKDLAVPDLLVIAEDQDHHVGTTQEIRGTLLIEEVTGTIEERVIMIDAEDPEKIGMSGEVVRPLIGDIVDETLEITLKAVVLRILTKVIKIETIDGKEIILQSMPTGLTKIIQTSLERHLPTTLFMTWARNLNSPWSRQFLSNLFQLSRSPLRLTLLLPCRPPMLLLKSMRRKFE